MSLRSKTKNKRCCFSFKNKKTLSQDMPPQSLELVLPPTQTLEEFYEISQCLNLLNLN
jgi:hypothetical protein